MNLFPINMLFWFLGTKRNELLVTEDKTRDRQICMVGAADWWLQWKPNVSGGTWSLTAQDFRKSVTVKDPKASETMVLFTHVLPVSSPFKNIHI